MGLYSGGLVIGRIFASEMWGAYFREGLLLFLFFWAEGGLIIGILRYSKQRRSLKKICKPQRSVNPTSKTEQRFPVALSLNVMFFTSENLYSKF